MHSTLRHRLLGRWSHLVGRWPRTVLAIAVAVAAASIWLTAARLQFQPDRNDLLSRSLPWNHTFIEWQQRFPGKDDLIVIVDAGQTGGKPTPIIALVEKLGQAIAASDGVLRVQWKFRRDEFSPKAVRLAPLPEVRRRVEEVNQSRDLLESPTYQAFIGAITRRLRESEKVDTQKPATEAIAQGMQAIAQIGELHRVIHSLHTRLTAPADNASPTLAALIEPPLAGDSYQTEGDRFFFIRITPKKDLGSLNEFATAITSIRTIIDAHRDEAAAHGHSIGLTGIPVIEMDETQIATRDSTIASIVSVALILGLLMLAFYSVRTPLLAVLSLLIGIAWSFGYATLAVGHLQVISVVFTVMLLSLGIAYGIHIIARIELVRHDYQRGHVGFLRTLRDTIETVGPGVFTGAITTAAAFVTTVFTDFKGVAEMGNIAAAGIGLCLLAMFSVFPALLSIYRHKRKHVKPMAKREFHFFEERWSMPFVRRPWLSLGLAIVMTGASLLAITRMYFDFDLLELFPRNVESVDWQTRLSQAGRPIYFGVSVCNDIDEARATATLLRDKPTVAGFGGIGLLFPEEDDRKTALATEARNTLGPLIEKARADGPQPPVTDPTPTFQALQLAMTLGLAREMPPQIREALTQLSDELTKLVTALDAMEPQARLQSSARVQREFDEWRRSVAARLDQMLDTTPLTPADVPHDLLAPYISPADGKVALEVYPRLPSQIDSVLDPAFLPGYVAEMESVDPHITGPAPQIYRSGVLIKESYTVAGLFALGVVFGLVYLDFRKLADALLALVPVGIGFAITFGIMWLLDMQINAANIIVLPLMFGIGVDAGVHMIHRYRQSPTTRPLGLADGTGKGITITNLATVLGFGTLMLARHRGVASLGFVLTVGIALTTLACWTVMPAILELLQRHRERRAVNKV